MTSGSAGFGHGNRDSPGFVDEFAPGDNLCAPLPAANIHVLLMPSGMRDRGTWRRPFAMGSMVEYDLVVIGSGPGGQKAAIAAAKLGKSVAVVERGRMLGGVCVNTGTIPSKTLREAVVYLTGMSQRELYGASYRVKEKITPADLLARTTHVIGKEQDVVRSTHAQPHRSDPGPRPIRRRAHRTGRGADP